MTHPDNNPPRPSRAKRRRLATVPIRTRIGSRTVFERRFNPIVREDGTFIWDRSELPDAIVAEQWWTVLDYDGELYLSPGFRFVNRFGYVRCATPWTDADRLQPDYRYD